MSAFRYPQTLDDAMSNVDLYRAQRDWYAIRYGPVTGDDLKSMNDWVLAEADKHRRRRESEPLATI